MRLATDSAQLGIFEWTLATDTAVWENKRMYEIFGIPETKIAVNRIDSYWKPYTPKTCRALPGSWKKPAARRPFQGAYRIRRVNDGQWRWIQYFAQFELAPDGKPLRLLGGPSDITERKQAEAQICSSGKLPRTEPQLHIRDRFRGQDYLSANPSMWRRFPTLEMDGLEHPLLKDWSSVAAKVRAGAAQVVEREVETGGLVLLQLLTLRNPASSALTALTSPSASRRKSAAAERKAVPRTRRRNSAVGLDDESGWLDLLV